MITVEPIEPDRVISDDDVNAPYWENVPFLGAWVAVWPEGLETDASGLCDATADDLERAARILLTAAVWMREHPPTGEEGDLR